MIDIQISNQCVVTTLSGCETKTENPFQGSRFQVQGPERRFYRKTFTLPMKHQGVSVLGRPDPPKHQDPTLYLSWNHVED